VAGGRIERCAMAAKHGTQIESVRFFTICGAPEISSLGKYGEPESRASASSSGDGHPEIAFAFVRDEGSFSTARPANLVDRIRDLHGKELVDRLLAVEEPAARANIRSALMGGGVSRQTAPTARPRERPRRSKTVGSAPCAKVSHGADEGSIPSRSCFSNRSRR